MNELVVNDNSEIGNMIFAIRGKQVIIDKEISRTKCHNYFYDMMITLCNHIEIRLELKIC